MNTVIDQKLKAKETRRAHVLKALKTYPVVLTLKTNMPGSQSNTPETAYILRRLSAHIDTLFATKGTVYQAADGDYILYGLNKDALAVKKTSFFIETHHPLGRLVDLDVSTQEKQLTRRDLSLPERPCFLCANSATYCRRNQTHPSDELIWFVRKTVQSDIMNHLSLQAILALRKELFTYPCFGLVSSKTTGIHTDMNISHFLAAHPVLLKAFKTYIDLGLRDDVEIATLKALGKKTEQALLEACNGVNTYKGAHYIFGHVLPHLARALLQDKSLNTVITDVKKTGQRLMEQGFKTPTKTTGINAYQNHGIQGVRGEVASGFPSIFSWYHEARFTPQETLIKIMARLDDTTLMKQDVKTLHAVKKAMKQVEDQGFKDILPVYDAFKHVSPGGAADLLALVFLFDAITPCLNTA